MDLIRKISKLFHISGEEAPRIIITTKSLSENEIKKYEKEIENKENEKEKPEKNKNVPKNPPNET
jgi:hypothetical protein